LFTEERKEGEIFEHRYDTKSKLTVESSLSLPVSPPSVKEEEKENQVSLVHKFLSGYQRVVDRSCSWFFGTDNQQSGMFST